MSSDPTTTFPAADAPPPTEAYPPYSAPYAEEPPPPPPPARPMPARSRRRDHVLVLLWSVVLSVAVFAPILGGRGISLRGGMVFTPDVPLKGALLGLDGWAIGTVPADFLVGVLTFIAPGDIVQKVILLTIVILAGTGAGALLSDLGLVARLAAATFFVWNPFVYERLLTGHWTLLVGYAALPWIAWSARRVTDSGRLGELAGVVVFLTIAGWASPVGGVIGLLLAVILVARRSARGALLVLVAGLVVNLPWIVPGLLRPGGATGTVEAVDAFAATPETPLGLLGSMATLSGIWDSAAYVPGRETTVMAIVALVVTLLAIGGALFASRRWDGAAVGGLTALAVLGVVIALLGSLAGTRSVAESLVDDIPGGGLLADGHAWLAPLALLLAVGFGAGAGLLAQLAAERAGPPLVAVVGLVAVAIPIAILPSLALAADGELDDTRYPGDWWEVRSTLISRDPVGTLVLPFEAEREFEWNDDRTSADPARLYFPGDVIAEDQRVADGVTVPGTDPRVETIREALSGDPADFESTLLASGIDTIVVERHVSGLGAPGPIQGERIHRGAELVVYALEGEAATPDRDLPPGWLILGVDVLAALAALGAVGAWIARGRRRDDVDDKNAEFAQYA